MSSIGDAAHPAVYYDGISSRRRQVELRLGAQLDIAEHGIVLATWRYDDIRRVDGARGLRLTSAAAAAQARLEIEDEAVQRLLTARCTALDQDRGGGQALRIVAWSLAAAASIVLMTLYGIPLVADRLATVVPVSVEQRLGDAVDKQVRALMGGKSCTGAEGQRAFTKMVEALKTAGGSAIPLEAQVLSSPIPNAVALPGGRIYLFEGLLSRARDPDEVAGVIAHEIGHAEHRDGLRSVIRTGGTSFLFGLLFGDITGSGAVIFASRTLLDASYSREAETAADDFAIRAMTNLGRSPAPLGEFLVRITGNGGKTTIIDSHPVSSERLERMKRAAPATAGPPILTDSEWQALKRVCAAG
ncbi:metalloendopeptidase [Bosea sp. Tri-44]|uniref:M48 family metallopeptidase n=1 Tax=Bosea sp. Tri-44 TaxID=1972137 RepID=UPI00100DB571|nr:M48 family metallopeptidase [Bosea sp. Tri-44]RXT57605.1 metalloendopeptidase [Bosea sp. Tri-44]